MLTLLLSLFSVIIIEGDIKGVWLHISPSETLSLNGKGIESITKQDSTFIHLELSVKMGGFLIDLRETQENLRKCRIHTFLSTGEIDGH